MIVLLREDAAIHATNLMMVALVACSMLHASLTEKMATRLSSQEM